MRGRGGEEQTPPSHSLRGRGRDGGKRVSMMREGWCKGSKCSGAKSIIEWGPRSPQLSDYIHTDNDHYLICMINLEYRIREYYIWKLEWEQQ